MEATEIVSKINSDDNSCPKLLPSPFQMATSAQSTITKLDKNLVQSPSNYFHGYRSNFNINQQKQSYEQYKRQQFEQRQQFMHQEPQPPANHSARGNYRQQRGPNYRSNNNNSQSHFHTNKNYQHEGNGGWCDLCERGFKNQQQLDKHMDEHEKCCYDGCNFEGQMSLLKKHIEIQHNSGLFKKIEKIEADEDIDKWREERRKRYPTKANIEARQLAQEERMKRGERLMEPNNRFGKYSDRKSARQPYPQPGKNRNEVNKEKQKRKRNRKQRNKRTNTNTNGKSTDQVKFEQANCDDNTEVTRFGGIGQLEQTQNSSNIESKEKVNALTALLGIYGLDSETDYEDEQEKDDTDNCNQTNAEVCANIIIGETIVEDKNNTYDVIQPAEANIGICTEIESKTEIGTKDVTEIKTELNTTAVQLNESNECKTLTTMNPSNNYQPLEENPIKSFDNDLKENIENGNNRREDISAPMDHSSDDEPPEEESIRYANVIFKESTENENNQPLQLHENNPSDGNRKRAADSIVDLALPSKLPKKRTVFDLTRKIRNQNSLLEKLLQKDIRHERNVLLQCVRFVVENKFFDVGQETDVEKPQ